MPSTGIGSVFRSAIMNKIPKGDYQVSDYPGTHNISLKFRAYVSHLIFLEIELPSSRKFSKRSMVLN